MGVALHALPAARNSAFLISASVAHYACKTCNILLLPVAWFTGCYVCAFDG